MKNTIKILSLMAAGLVAATSQVQAVATADSTHYIPLTITATGVTGKGATNALGTVITYSGKSVVVNNASIMSEFYLSDRPKLGVTNDLTLVNTTVGPAAGDWLAVVATSFNTTTNIRIRLQNGEIKFIATNDTRAFDPWTGRHAAVGDIVIISAKGNVKADLTQSGDANNLFDGLNRDWSYSPPTRGVFTLNNNPRDKSLVWHAFIDLDFTFSFASFYAPINPAPTAAPYPGDEEFDVDYFGGGTYVRTGILLNGNASFTGGGSAFWSNPARHVTGSDDIFIINTTAALPGATQWFWDHNFD